MPALIFLNIKTVRHPFSGAFFNFEDKQELFAGEWLPSFVACIQYFFFSLILLLFILLQYILFLSQPDVRLCSPLFISPMASLNTNNCHNFTTIARQSLTILLQVIKISIITINLLSLINEMIISE